MKQKTKKKVITDGWVQRFLKRQFACAKLMTTVTVLQCVDSHTFASAQSIWVRDEPPLGNPLCAGCPVGRANRKSIAVNALLCPSGPPAKKPRKKKPPPPS